MAAQVKYKDLAWAFFRVGILGFGGGPTSIPLIHKEVVDKYKWMSDDEFADILAIGNTIPGPIITKIAGYVGYRIAGMTGLLIALATSILPTVVLVIGLLKLLEFYKDLPVVSNMAAAVIPVAAVMLGAMTLEFFKKSKKDMSMQRLLAITVVAFITIQLLDIHPAIIIAIVIIIIFSPLLRGIRK